MSTIKSSAENLTLNADGANNDIKFQSNGSEVASIDQAGLVTASALNTTGTVGIGIAPKTTSSSFDSLQIGGGGSISAYYNGENGAGTDFGNNFYVNSGGSERYIFTEEAAKAKFEQGNVELYVAASGSADAAITWTKGFEVLNSGKARAKNGLLFGTDTAASNALDDYEEGTWTPTLTIGGTVGYGTREGSYTKVGNLVNINFAISINSISSLSSTVGISGFPFTSATSSAGDSSPVQFGLIRSLATDYPNIRGYVAGGNTVCSFSVQATNAGHTGLPGTAITTSSLIYGSATYRTA